MMIWCSLCTEIAILVVQIKLYFGTYWLVVVAFKLSYYLCFRKTALREANGQFCWHLSCKDQVLVNELKKQGNTPCQRNNIMWLKVQSEYQPWVLFDVSFNVEKKITAVTTEIRNINIHSDSILVFFSFFVSKRRKVSH